MKHKQRFDMIVKIEKQWLDRAKANDWKPGSMKYRRHEVEFFTGAMSALNAAFPDKENADLLSSVVPNYWVINALSGRPIVDPDTVAARENRASAKEKA